MTARSFVETMSEKCTIESLFIFALVFGWCLAVAPQSHAVLITHNGAQVQADDFEDDTAGNNPSSPPWHGKSGTTLNTTIQVADSNPAAAQGANYLVFDRAQAGGLEGRGYIDGFGTLNSGTVGASFMLYVPSTNNVSLTNSAEGKIGLGPSLSGGLFLAVGQEDSSGQFSIDYFHGGHAVWEDSTVTYAYDRWQRWDMTVDISTGNATLAVDGTSANFNIGRLNFDVSRFELEGGWAYTGPHNKLYVDAVPEPSCLLLLAVALLSSTTVLRCRRIRFKIGKPAHQCAY